MVVALDLEGDRLTAAHVQDAGILAGSLQDPLARGRQSLQQQRRMLVAAVLRPEEREDGELEVVGLAAEQFADPVQLTVREAEGAVERLFGDPRQGSENRRPSGRVSLKECAAATSQSCFCLP
jgi:hypothetical protein